MLRLVAWLQLALLHHVIGERSERRALLDVERMDDAVSDHAPFDNVLVASSQYDWSEKIALQKDGALTCTCGGGTGTCPFDATKEGLSRFMQTSYEVCFEISVPVLPGVRCILALGGGISYAGDVAAKGPKSISVSINTGVIARLPPVSVFLTIKGTLKIQSRGADSFSTLLKNAVRGIVGWKLSRIKDDTAEKNELITEAVSKLQALDDGLREARADGYGEGKEASPEAATNFARWKIANAEKMSVLLTGLSFKAADRAQDIKHEWEDMLKKLEEFGFGSGKQAPTATADLSKLKAQMVAWEKSYGITRDACPGCRVKRSVARWLSGKYQAKEVYVALAELLSSVLISETTRLATDLSEVAINTLFDPEFKFPQEFKCSQAPKTAIVDLPACAGTESWDCYPQLHNGEKLQVMVDTALYKEKLRYLKRDEDKLQASVNGKMLCSLLESYDLTAQSRSDGPHFDPGKHLVDWEWVAGDGTSRTLPYAALVVLKGWFDVLVLLQESAAKSDDDTERLDVNQLNQLDDQALVDIINGRLKDWKQLVKVVNTYSDEETAADLIMQSNQEMFGTRWDRTPECKTKLGAMAEETADTQGLDICATQGVTGWLYDFATRSKIQENLQHALENQIAAQRAAMQSEMSFTWQFEGSAIFAADFTMAFDQSHCTPQTDQFQVEVNGLLEQRVTLSNTGSGAVAKFAPVKGRMVFGVGLFPLGNNKFGFHHRRLLEEKGPNGQTPPNTKGRWGRDLRRHMITAAGATDVSIELGVYDGGWEELLALSLHLYKPILKAASVFFASPATEDLPENGGDLPKETSFKNKLKNVWENFLESAKGGALGAALQTGVIAAAVQSSVVRTRVVLNIQVVHPSEAGKPTKVMMFLKSTLIVGAGETLANILGNAVPLGVVALKSGRTLDISGLALLKTCTGQSSVKAEPIARESELLDAEEGAG
eukprot:TRINITY_DN24980_c1_g1_i1.p1 TRINITY_DN24980_c1_g1~~TRINITY_DN24980_c1_g1_i1.p1  ORF type:complete len:946 (-),score=167.21 TRINITY_DN24980_c1_g1_i1:54-2891(-)